MRRVGVLIGLLIWITMAVTCGAAEVREEWTGRDYLIGPGDVLYISIWQNADLTRSVPVLPDGKIAFPLIGEVVAEGKTVALLKKELEEKFSTYVPEPVLTVMVQQVNSIFIYIIGKVNHPGRFELNTNVNVLQVLTMAGGVNVFAKSHKIKIYREKDGETLILPFDYEEVIDGENLQQNILLKRGDIIVVP